MCSKKVIGQKSITPSYAEELRENSLLLAKKKGFSKEVIEILENIPIRILEDEEKVSNAWYGYARYGDNADDRHIGLYRNNILSGGKMGIINSLNDKGISRGYLTFIKFVSKLIPYEHLKFIVDQSGMDHELIGHMGNYLEGNPHYEKEAILAQLDGFKNRSGIKGIGIYWWILSKIGKVILNTHKKEDLEYENKSSSKE